MIVSRQLPDHKNITNSHLAMMQALVGLLYLKKRGWKLPIHAHSQIATDIANSHVALMQALAGLIFKTERFLFHVGSQATKDITDSHVAKMQALAGLM